MSASPVLKVYLTLPILLTIDNSNWSFSPSLLLATVLLFSCWYLGQGCLFLLLQPIAHLLILERPSLTTQLNLGPLTLPISSVTLVHRTFHSLQFCNSLFIVCLSHWTKSSTREGVIYVSSPLSLSTLHIVIQRVFERINERLTCFLYFVYSFKTKDHENYISDSISF